MKETKRCPRCQKTFGRGEFYSRPNGQLCAYCKRCEADKVHIYQLSKLSLEELQKRLARAEGIVKNIKKVMEKRLESI